jgi:hypothetical protein
MFLWDGPGLCARELVSGLDGEAYQQARLRAALALIMAMMTYGIAETGELQPEHRTVDRGATSGGAGIPPEQIDGADMSGPDGTSLKTIWCCM